jgi:hypothetical protein
VSATGRYNLRQAIRVYSNIGERTFHPTALT